MGWQVPVEAPRQSSAGTIAISAQRPTTALAPRRRFALMTSSATIGRPAISAQRAGTSVEYAVETVEQPDCPRGPMRTLRRLQTVISVTDGVVYVEAGEHDVVLTPGDET